VAVVQAEGELDIATAGQLADALSMACALRSSRVAVDVALLSFMDCSALDVLVAAHKRLLNEERSGLSVRGSSGIVRRLFEVTHLTALLDDRTELDFGRMAARLSVRELFIDYFALGGTANLGEIAAHVQGVAELDDHQQDIAALAVNERLAEIGRWRHFLPYTSDTPTEESRA
jgi:anti-anti-sigma factor